MLRSSLLTALAALLLGAAVPVLADEEPPPPFRVGESLPALTLEDQYGEVHTLGAAVERVLFTRDMDGGRLIREALAEDGKARLERADAIVIADVHRMPGIIRATMAKPSMRRRGYPMWLDESGEPTARLPSAEGRATLLRLDDRRLTAIEHLTTAEAVRAALGPPPKDPAEDLD